MTASKKQLSKKQRDRQDILAKGSQKQSERDKTLHQVSKEAEQNVFQARLESLNQARELSLDNLKELQQELKKPVHQMPLVNCRHKPAEYDENVRWLDEEVSRLTTEFNTINKILNQFEDKIGTIGNKHPQAKNTAESLLEELRQFNKESVQNPHRFLQQAQDAIQKAMPVLQKDLGWRDFLENMLKKIANAVTRAVSFGSHQGFFDPKKPEAVQHAQSLSEKLQQERPNNEPSV